MGQARNVGLGVASVEWLRQHGGNPLVSQIENGYYTLTAPERAGRRCSSLPQVGVAAAAETGRAITGCLQAAERGAADPPGAAR